MELRHLRYFLAVVEHGAINRAASHLNIVQPALSRQIKDLEDELGARLLERTSRGVVITPTGRQFATDVAAILEDLSRAKQRASAEEVRIAVLRNVTRFPFLSAGLRAFSNLNPSTTVKLSRLTAGEMREAMKTEEFNVIVAYAGSCSLTGFHKIDIHKEQLHVAIDAGHRLCSKASISLSDLSTESFLWYSRRSSPELYDILIASCQRSGFLPKIICEMAEGSDAAIDLIRAGAACAFVGSMSAATADLRGVIVKPVQDLEIELRLQLAWRAKHTRGRRFARAMLPALREHRRAAALAA